MKNSKRLLNKNKGKILYSFKKSVTFILKGISILQNNWIYEFHNDDIYLIAIILVILIINNSNNHK